PLQAGQSQVEDLDRLNHRRARLRQLQNHVGGLDVTVDKSTLVGMLQTQGRLANVLAGLRDWQRSRPIYQPVQVFFLNARRGQEVCTSDGPGVEGADDVAVVEPADNFHFAVESADHLGVRHEFLANDLQGNDAIHGQLPGLVNFPHAAFAEAFQHQVV